MRECFSTSDFDNLSFGSVSLSFWISFLEVILDDQAFLRSEDSYPIICLCLDLYQAGSFLSSPSPEPSHKRTLSTLQHKRPHIKLVSLFRAHAEQLQVNSLRISLLKTWILSPIPPGYLTTITQRVEMMNSHLHHLLPRLRYLSEFLS
ncbi:hypothetical protein XENOCAPTIV_015627 [Xenoophorus captivus]|uniref:Maturase K n=1 Tax=Xenoophorus captivus TaxID=1517983 RepID=A0ABV0QIG8_9TELE